MGLFSVAWVFLCLCWFGLVQVEGVVSGLNAVGEVFVAQVVSGGKVTIPLLVRHMLKIKEGDYVRVSISEVIRKKQQEQKGKKGIRK